MGLGDIDNQTRSYMDVTYLTIVVVCHIGLGFCWAKWAIVAHFHFWGHFWPFFAIFQMALANKILQV